MTMKLFCAGVAAIALVAACSNDMTPGANEPMPSGAMSPRMPSPMAGQAQPDADMGAVLAKLASLGGRPIETLSPQEARRQPTPADAVRAIMIERGMPSSMAVTTQDVMYPAGAGQQKARIYKPAHASGRLPVILYIHGGGWVIADIDVYDASPRAIAEMANAIVVSIEYRHAPEAKFPAAHDDANAAWQWMLREAAQWGGDPARVAVIGESAGGNMAVNVAISARDRGWTQPKAVVAIYPVANTSMTLRSKQVHAAAKPLNTPMLGWFFQHTLANPSQAQDPRLNLVAANLRGLPRTSIILAEIDPLHDDGATLADALRGAGVQVDLREYAGVTHEFFGMGSVVADAKAAEQHAADQLKAALR